MKKENKKTKKTCAPDDLITYRYLDTWVFADCWGLGLFFFKKPYKRLLPRQNNSL